MTFRQLQELKKLRREETANYYMMKKKKKDSKQSAPKTLQPIISAKIHKQEPVKEHPYFKNWDGVYKLTAAIIISALKEYLESGQEWFFKTEFFLCTGLDAEYLKLTAKKYGTKAFKRNYLKYGNK